jgi:hypothetical protein
LLLTALVGVANKVADQGSAIEISLTLTVGGLLISGTTVSRQAYYAGLAAGIRAATGNASSEFLEAFAEPLDEAAKPTSPEGEPDGQKSQPVYIHLRDVQMFHAAFGSGVAKALWWRGRLAAVDGFILGLATT